jgi:hypothetical protein
MLKQNSSGSNRRIRRDQASSAYIVLIVTNVSKNVSVGYEINQIIRFHSCDVLQRRFLDQFKNISMYKFERLFDLRLCVLNYIGILLKNQFLV